MSKGFQTEKKLVREYFDRLEHCTPDEAKDVLSTYMSDDYFWEGPYPFMDKNGATNVAEDFWKPLKKSLKKMQRRQDVFIAGIPKDGRTWVMSMGQFMGIFVEDFLGIRHTNKMQHLQYCEYSCVVDGKIVHTALFLDFVGFMLEAGAYPLTPMLGNYFVYPGPREHNGLLYEDADPKQSDATFKVVVQMMDELEQLFLDDITDKKATYDILKRTWAEDMIWYGPCGEGAGYTIEGYQRHHHHPFCDNLPGTIINDMHAYFAEGDFATYFTSLKTFPKGGWLGMPGGAENIHMRGDIDIYYVKDGKISENWCFIDIPFWLNEQGIDIFKRTEEILNS